MATRITQGEAVLFDSVTGNAFGPVWSDYEEAEDFLSWTDTEFTARVEDLTPAELSKAIAEWRAEREPVAAVQGLRERVQVLKREQAELEDGRTYRRYAEEGVARERLSRTPTPSAAVDAAVSAYVRDNGDCVPQEVVEGIQAEVERILNQPIVETRAEG